MPVAPGTSPALSLPDAAKGVFSLLIAAIDDCLGMNRTLIEPGDFQKYGATLAPQWKDALIAAVIAHYTEIGWKCQFEKGNGMYGYETPERFNFEFVPGVSQEISMSAEMVKQVNAAFAVIDSKINVSGIVWFSDLLISPAFKNRFVFEVRKAYEPLGWIIEHDKGNAQREVEEHLVFKAKK